jgi:hypothetical protein
MRTLSEILDVAKTGGEWPTHEECFWAMQALEQVWTMTQRAYQDQVFAPRSEAAARMKAENNFQMAKRCLGANPKTWLGPDRDYSKPENRKRREIALKIYDKASKGELPTQKLND